MKFKREHVDKVYDEIDRRVARFIHEGSIENEQELHEAREAMLQGVYSTLMVLADNWPAVRYWGDVNEESRGYYKS